MGYPVLMIHGMWCTGANWNRIKELMTLRGYDCHNPTLPAPQTRPNPAPGVAGKTPPHHIPCFGGYFPQERGVGR